ncbi:isoprenoid synthase domain-containing protein [Mycena leptocephala]|nr:isoprenoid synthase domain-containing protein [Mycena leptocephala]
MPRNPPKNSSASPPPRPPWPATFSPALAPAPPTPAPADPGCMLPTQLRLAQIVDMIHVASLLHDDVIDASALRRSAPSAPAAFGNKLAVLGGDFLLGRASTALSRLGDPEVVDLIAVIADLVDGEILQTKDVHRATKPTGGSNTASPMAKGCRASVILAQGEVWKELVGLAFQIVLCISLSFILYLSQWNL